MLKKVIMILLAVGFVHHIKGQTLVIHGDEDKQSQWVDSVYDHLSDSHKIGQLFMLGTYSNLNEAHYQRIQETIKNYNIGGLFFMQGGPGRQINLINKYQNVAQTPLLIGMDLEYGLGTWLDSTMTFPNQLTLGAIQNEQFIYNLGAEMARQCKIAGVHLSLAPVVDIYSNPLNPEIGLRSFGEDKNTVGRKGKAMMLGLMENGIIPSAKHFPGLGDASRDSQYRLPIVNHDLERLNNIELSPFKELIASDLPSVTVGHIKVPAIDSSKNIPASLSKNVVTDLLKDQLHFDGLIITEPMNQKSITRHFSPREANVMAIEAGNDLLLMPEEIPETISLLLKKIKKGEISWDRIEYSVKKILKAKYWAGLHKRQVLDHRYILDRLNTPQADLLKTKLFEKSITVAKNDRGFIPVRNLETSTFASLTFGGSSNNTFQKYLGKYVNFDHFHVSRNEKDEEIFDHLFDQLKSYGTVIIGVNEISNSSHNNFNTNELYLNFINELQDVTKVIVVVFGNPYSLSFFDEIDHVICTYQEGEETQILTPQIIFGALSASGKLPVTASEQMRIHQGADTKPLGRLAYSSPEDVGLDSEVLKRIDLIADEAITDKATPGCQILVAKNGAVIYEKSYGFFTYDKQTKVTDHTIYDLASLTKVVATLQTIMFLYDQGLLDVERKASYYLTDLKGTNKEDMLIKDILMHQAGLLTFIPFWVRTVDEKGLKNEIYSKSGGYPYDMEITDSLYGVESLQDSLWHWIKSSDLRPLKRNHVTYDYKYSDLGFYIMHRIAEKLLNQHMDEFLEQNIYQPLGMNFLSFLPLKKYPQQLIAPTEYDNYFRNTQIQGTVHDPGAAMMGGVAGHAGVFGNANDIAKIMQMNLQDGFYGGVQYYQSGTLRRFSQKQTEDNRRGLGWDKPELDNDNGPTSQYSSPATYGHTGFTGTAAWVDPVNDLIYIFLSNRIYPSANNFKLIKNNIRTRIQDIIYQSIVE